MTPTVTALPQGDDLSDLSISDDSSDEVQTTTNDAMDVETTEKQGNETEATLKGPAKPVKKKQGAKKQPTTETVKPATTKGQGVKKGKPAPKIKSEKPTKTSTPKKAKKPTPVTEKQKIEPTKAQQTKTAKKSPAKSPEKAKPSPTKPKPAPKPRTSLFPRTWRFTRNLQKIKMTFFLHTALEVVVGSKIKKKQPPPTPNTTPSQTAKNQRRKRRTSKSNKRKRVRVNCAFAFFEMSLNPFCKQENDDNTPLPAAKKKKIDVVVRYDKKEFLTTMLGKDAIAKAKLLPGPEKKFFGLLGDEDVERYATKNQDPDKNWAISSSETYL